MVSGEEARKELMRMEEAGTDIDAVMTIIKEKQQENVEIRLSTEYNSQEDESMRKSMTSMRKSQDIVRSSIDANEMAQTKTSILEFDDGPKTYFKSGQ